MQGQQLQHGYHHYQTARVPPPPVDTGLSRTYSRMSTTSYSTAAPYEPSPIHLSRSHSSRKFHLPETQSASFYDGGDGPAPKSKMNASFSTASALASLYDICRPAYFPKQNERRRSRSRSRSDMELTEIEEESQETPRQLAAALRSHYSSPMEAEVNASPVSRKMDEINSSALSVDMNEQELRTAINRRMQWQQGVHGRRLQRRSSLPSSTSSSHTRMDDSSSHSRRRKSLPASGSVTSNGLLPYRYSHHTISSEAKQHPERRVLPKHRSSSNVRKLELQLSGSPTAYSNDWLKTPPPGIQPPNRMHKGGGYSPSSSWCSPGKDEETERAYFKRITANIQNARRNTSDRSNSHRHMPSRKRDIHIRSRLKVDDSANELNDSGKVRFMQPTYSWSRQVKDPTQVRQRYKWAGKQCYSPQYKHRVYDSLSQLRRSNRDPLSLPPDQYHLLDTASTLVVDRNAAGGIDKKNALTIPSDQSVDVEVGTESSSRATSYTYKQVDENDDMRELEEADTASQSEIRKMLDSFNVMLDSANQHTSKIGHPSYG